MLRLRLGPLPRIKRSGLTLDCDREGRAALPLPRAAAISTSLRVRRAASKLDQRGVPVDQVRLHGQKARESATLEAARSST